jgi:hypothetical protein
MGALFEEFLSKIYHFKLCGELIGIGGAEGERVGGGVWGAGDVDSVLGAQGRGNGSSLCETCDAPHSRGSQGYLRLFP